MLMYALSTMAMNRRHFFQEHYGEKSAPFHTARETVYDGIFPEKASPHVMARQILQDLELDGTHYVRGGREGRPLTIWREAPLWIKRIIYRLQDHTLTIERQEFRTPVVLEELHRRRGFQHEYALEDLWGISVDVERIPLWPLY